MDWLDTVNWRTALAWLGAALVALGLIADAIDNSPWRRKR